ncbi:MAG TPA: hypothetical protein VL970_13215 [Candidatus Acidoferrales bacterium]|nr:hypothetical protein [Candidatus Acidoferrales bacterium]
MKRTIQLLAAVTALSASAITAAGRSDWLIDGSPFKAEITTNAQKHELVLDNGLLRRVFRLTPNAATVSFDNLMTGESILRAVRPEAVIELNGAKYEIGGLSGQPVQNFLKPEWIDRLTADPGAFQYAGCKEGRTEARFPWKQHREWMSRDLPWPAPGVSLTLEFKPPAGFGGANSTNVAAGNLTVEVHYELFDGIPLISKWMVVRNGMKMPVRLNKFTSELLAVTEAESVVGASPRWELPKLLVETDYAFGGAMGTLDTLPSVHWMPDPSYTSQVNYELQTPCLLECRPPIGPDQMIEPGESFESFRSFELVQDSTERERTSLARRRMYRLIAPWTAENPIFMHARNAEPAAVKLAVDQCAAVGFEMVILSFGSGFDFESRDPRYQANIKELVDYAKSKGIVLGGYSLCSSRSAGTPADNVVGSPVFGVAPCLGSVWGSNYLAQLRNMMEHTGLAALEHDGSYPGDTCAATNHPYHHGKEDSQWVQWKAITGLYKWCRAHGVYLNVPDWYFLSGSSKCGMGYREVNWSLPREYQEIIERQNIFDGTWEKTASMGWMFVPLTEYQGGGAAATIEPLKDHLAHYEQRLENLFGAGVIACYRGPRLYDSEETRTVVKRWVDFYKRHRQVLDGDILHLRRADGRDLDYILHVNPAGREKGLLMVYNPLAKEAGRTLRIPLYYTGKTSIAYVRELDAEPKRYALDRDYDIDLPVKIPAHGVTWFVVE